MQEAFVEVDVAALERAPLLGPEAGAGGEDRQHLEVPVDLLGEQHDRGPGEGGDFGAAGGPVRDAVARVRFDPVPRDRLLQHLPERLPHVGR